jgi:hypothetical protein
MDTLKATATYLTLKFQLRCNPNSRCFATFNQKSAPLPLLVLPSPSVCILDFGNIIIDINGIDLKKLV